MSNKKSREEKIVLSLTLNTEINLTKQDRDYLLGFIEDTISDLSNIEGLEVIETLSEDQLQEFNDNLIEKIDPQFNDYLRTRLNKINSEDNIKDIFLDSMEQELPYILTEDKDGDLTNQIILIAKEFISGKLEMFEQQKKKNEKIK